MNNLPIIFAGIILSLLPVSSDAPTDVTMVAVSAADVEKQVQEHLQDTGLKRTVSVDCNVNDDQIVLPAHTAKTLPPCVVKLDGVDEQFKASVTVQAQEKEVTVNVVLGEWIKTAH